MEKLKMMGAVTGDIAGSTYEWSNIKYVLKEDSLIDATCQFTDDSVMTCAVAEGLVNSLGESDETIKKNLCQAMKKYGRMYPNAGYGGRFYQWLMRKNSDPYNSLGNGAAMRVSAAGWLAKSLDEAEHLGELTAVVTHNHPEGLKAARVVAGCIYLMRTTQDKEAVRTYASQSYHLDFTLDEIRPTYTFDVTCQGSVPQAIVAFLEGQSFSEVIALAISIGGDSDTIAAIAGSIAEACYEIPDGVYRRASRFLDVPLLETIKEINKYIND